MNIMIIAPHPDDELIGVGGTIFKRTFFCKDEVTVVVVTKGLEPLFQTEYIETGRKEDQEANKMLGTKNHIFLDFPANGLESVPKYELNKAIDDLVKTLKPEEVYIPFYGDIHIDHRIVAEAAMVACRPKGGCSVKKILSYEVPSETGWNNCSSVNSFIPTVYEDISDSVELKKQALRVMKSQIDEKQGARSVESITALAKYRGATIGKHYAEAFMLQREIK